MDIWLDEAEAVVRRADGTVERYSEVVLCSRDDGDVERVLSQPITLRCGDCVSLTTQLR